MVEDIVDLSAVGGYAAIHDRERAGLRSSSNLVKRHVRWDEAWSGRVPSSRGTDDTYESRSAERNRGGRSTSSRRTRATSPERLQSGWVGPMSREPPRADVKRRASSQPRSRGTSSHDVFRLNPRSVAHRNDDDTYPPTPRSRLEAPTEFKRPHSVTHLNGDVPRTSHPSWSKSNSNENRRKNQMRSLLKKRVTLLSKVLKNNPTAYDSGKRRISVVECEVTAVDVLNSETEKGKGYEQLVACSNLERFYASRNSIASLKNFAQFPNLRLLSAGDNPIDDIAQVDLLARGCPLLEVLSLERTPVSTLPFYRQHVIARFTHLKMLDGINVSPNERADASQLVRMDVAFLENLMRSASTVQKLKRAYCLSRVHEELRQVVFTARGPVSPQSLPSRDECSAPLDVRRWLRLCAPEKSMTRNEVTQFAKQLRIRVAFEAPEIKKQLLQQYGGEWKSNTTRNAIQLDRSLWEGAYSLVMKREQGDAAALLAYLEDRSAAFTEAVDTKLNSDPFATALRYGFEAAAARELEMRSDRERALGDIIDAEAAATFRITEEFERDEMSSSSSRAVNSDTRAVRQEQYQKDKDTVSRRTTKVQPPRDNGYDFHDDHSNDAWEAWYQSERRVSSTEANTIKHGRPSDSARSSHNNSKVPWGHGPGGRAEVERAMLAKERRVGDSYASTRVARSYRVNSGTASRRTRSESPTRQNARHQPQTPSHSPPRRRPGERGRYAESSRYVDHDEDEWDEDEYDGRATSRRPPTSIPTTSFGPVDPSALTQGGVYDVLGAEVDALRAALESQTKGEQELLAVNAVLLKRCEEAETAAEGFRKAQSIDAARHTEQLRDSRAETEAAESHAKELAAALDETAESADSADQRDLKSRLAKEQAEAEMNSLRAELLSLRADAESLREALAEKIRDEERVANADALSSKSAGRRILRHWLKKTKGNQKLRVCRAIHLRRHLDFSFNVWRSRAQNQIKLRSLRRKRLCIGAVAALRAWRLHRLVSEVSTVLCKRRVLRRWQRETERREKIRAVFASDGVFKANAVAQAGDAFAPVGYVDEDSSQTNNSPEPRIYATREVVERNIEAGLSNAQTDKKADVLLAWREHASVSQTNRRKKVALDEYANAVLSAAKPNATRLRIKSLLATSISTWHLAVTRAQQVRLETLVQTCDALGGAAERAAEEANKVEATNRELRERLDSERKEKAKESWEKEETKADTSTQPKGAPEPKNAAELVAVEESNFEREKARLQKSLETERNARKLAEDEAKILKRRVSGESEETKRAEQVAAAAAGEAAAWRSAAVKNERAVNNVVNTFVEWSLALEDERHGFGRNVGESTVKKSSTLRKSAFSFDTPGSSAVNNRTPSSSDTQSSKGSSGGHSETPSSGSLITPVSELGQLRRALLVFGLDKDGKEVSTEKEGSSSLINSKISGLPPPARHAASYLQTHQCLARALRRCGEIESDKRMAAESNHQGAKEAADAARERVGKETSAATDAAAAAIEAEAAATILQSAMRGHLVRKKSLKKSKVCKEKDRRKDTTTLDDAFDKVKSGESEASGENIFAEKGSTSKPKSVASNKVRNKSEMTSPGVEQSQTVSPEIYSHRRPAYDETTQTPPALEDRETQTPTKKKIKGKSASPSPSMKNPFSSAKRMLREGRVVITPTPTKSIRSLSASASPSNPPWRPPSTSVYDSPLSPPMSPRRG